MKQVSVTTALGVFANFDMIRPDILEAAKIRGSGVHAAAAAYSAGLYVPPLPVEWQGYFDSFRGWFDTYVERVLFIEERFHNKIFFYNGKPDLGAVLVDGRRVVVDYKTPAAEMPTWKSQIAAYCDLAEGVYPPAFEGMSLRLRKDGRQARANVYDSNGNDYAAFLAALTAFRYFKT